MKTRNAAQGQNNILIIRPSSMGDVVMASPMISSIKSAFPGASVAWLLDPNLTDLLKFHPLLDEIIPWEKTLWKKLWRKGRLIRLITEVIRFRKDLRARQFHLALEAQGLLRARFLAWLSGANQKIGFNSKEPGHFLMDRIISRGPESKLMSSEYYYMVKELGVAPRRPFLPSLGISRAWIQSAEQKLYKARVTPPYAVFCPFTTRPQKHWLGERWASLAFAIYREFGLTPVVMGAKTDHEKARDIASSVGTPIAELAGQTSLGEAMALVQQAALVVGVDTGLTHMGTAFRVPAVALFGATCPYLKTESHLTRVLYHKLDCSPCKRSPTCNGQFTCMEKITVEQVVETVRELREEVQ